MRVQLIIAAGLAAAAPLPAQSPPPCPPGAPTAPAYPGWTEARPPGPAGLAPGRSARVALAPGVRFAATTRRTPTPDGRGASVPLTVPTAGTYEVALSDAAWLDLVRDGRAEPSTAHRHGPACSGVRKIVTFRLTPGRYALQLSEAAAPEVTVAVAKID